MYRTLNSTNVLLGLAIVAVIVSGCFAIAEQDNMVFPGKEWQRRAPEELGFSKAVVNALGRKMKNHWSNGVLIRNGYLIAEWNFGGPSDKKFMVQSTSKSITSMVLGLAVQDGLIPSIDAKVKDYWSAFDTTSPYAGPYTDEVTFRQLSNMTAGLADVRFYGLKYVDPANAKPGTEHHYHNDQPQALARALTYIYGKTLQEVLQEKALDHLQADMEWQVDMDETTMKTSNGKMVPINYGHSYTHWNAPDLAKVGHLYLNNGKWKNKRILPESFVKETFTDIPLKVNKWIDDKRITTQTPERMASLGYGLAWWTKRDKDVSLWKMSGFGDQCCIVLPDHNVVLVKVNNWKTPGGTFVSELPEIGPSIMDILCDWAADDFKKPIDDKDFVSIKDEGFRGQMSKYETTNAQYTEFLNDALASGEIIVSENDVKGAAGSYSGKVYYQLDGNGLTRNGATNGGAARIEYEDGRFTVVAGFKNHPITWVSWYGAMAFADYYGWRLPTEDEWQAVADYEGNYNYGCGEKINHNIANYRGSDHPHGTTQVGSYGTFGYGMADMAGNVWEWTSSTWLPESSFPVFRGGSWFLDSGHSKVTYRINRSPGLMNHRIGFRVCR